MRRRRPPLLWGLATLVAMIGLALSSAVHATADGPDLWDVTGVRAPDVLSVHTRANAASPVVASIPADARGLRNLGCTGTPSFAQWLEMTPSERALSGRARWCRIAYGGIEGWVAGRYLREGSGDVTVGRWTVACRERPCVIEQTGLAARRPTRLRIAPQAAGNAAVSILRKPVPRQGTLAIHVDGKLLSSGPVAPLRSADGRALVMTPDDITAGLLRALAGHKTLVLTFPGEGAGVEFHLDGFEDALRRASETAR